MVQEIIYRNRMKIEKLWKDILDQINISKQINIRVQSFILKEQLYPMQVLVNIPKKHALEFSKIEQSQMIYNYYNSILSDYVSNSTEFKIVNIEYKLVDKNPGVLLYVQPKTILDKIVESFSHFLV